MLFEYQMNLLAAEDESTCSLLNDKHIGYMNTSNIYIGCLGRGC